MPRADEERLGVVWEPAARREQPHQNHVRPEARRAQTDAAPQPVGNVVQRPRRDGQSEEGAGDRAAEHRRRGQSEGQWVVATPEREQRAQTEGEAHCEREPPDEQVDERAEAEPPRRQAPPREPDDQAVERPARHERADDSGDADPERGGDRRQQDAVAGDVVAREPLQVEHLAEPLGEDGVVHLGRVVVALERPGDDHCGEHADDPPDGDLGELEPPVSRRDLHVVSDDEATGGCSLLSGTVRTVEPQ